jgi:predicted DNA-binding protein (MmcQ/YjbR family)
MADTFQRPVFARTRRLCLALPETTETSSWGHPNFRVGRKTFCTFEIVKGRPSVAFRLGAVDRTALLRQKAFFETPYGRGLWVSVWMDVAIDWASIRVLVKQSYRVVASKRLVSLVDPPARKRS